MQLSDRLKTVCSMVSDGHTAADVGTDHGYIPIWLVQNKKVPRAVAMDLREGPLDRARANVQRYGLEHYIDLRLGDGVSRLVPGEAETVIIAGMGGGLVKKILDEGEKVLADIKEVILQPQSEVDLVREYLSDHSYRIIQEEMLREEGKYYTVIKAVHDQDTIEKKAVYYKYGKLLLENKHPVLKVFLAEEMEKVSDILHHLETQDSQSAKQRIEELKTELHDIKEALYYYGE